MTTTNPTNRGLKYDPTVAASGYSAATGVGAGFSLSAVVLVFTIAATTTQRSYYLGFAAAMFTLSTVGLLFCSFSYATLSSVNASPSAFLHLMLNAAGLTICFLSELAGFDALARAYVPRTSLIFSLHHLRERCRQPGLDMDDPG